MEAFAAHPAVKALFRVELFRCDAEEGGVEADYYCYDEAVRDLHRSYVADPNYTPTIHCPHLIRLTRL